MKKLRLLAPLLALSLAWGCASMPWSKNDDSVPGVAGADASSPGIIQESEPMDPLPGAGLPLATSQRFPDIPLPLGVKEDIDRTYVYQSSGGFRVGRMVYTSHDKVPDLAQFFIRECPVAGWTLQTAVQAEGVQLQFLKGSERLDVSVKSLGVGRSNELILHLTPTDSGAVN